MFSCVTGQVKPDPPNYLSGCARLDIVPQRCVYVGDGGSDELVGAARLSMHPVHLDVPVERGGVVYGRHGIWQCDVIESLLELEPLLLALADGPSGSGSTESHRRVRRLWCAPTRRPHLEREAVRSSRARAGS